MTSASSPTPLHKRLQTTVAIYTHPFVPTGNVPQGSCVPHPLRAGLVTFWQAVLVGVHRVKLAMDAISGMCDRDVQIPLTCITDIAYPLGQIVNTIVSAPLPAGCRRESPHPP